MSLSGEAKARGALWNEDLAPTDLEHRTWSRWNIAALWIGMSVCIPTYMLAAGLVTQGMTWWQAVVTVLLGNLIVLVPMALNAHAGTKYGIPFPVLIRASFGPYGSNVPALLRAFVACGWFGIQTWLGGAAVYTLLGVFFPGWKGMAKIEAIGLSLPEVLCFLGFWVWNVYYVVRGTESIKWLETLSAPVLIGIGLALLGWGATNGGGLGNVLAKSEQFANASVVARGADGRAAVELRSFDGRATQAKVATIAADETPPKAIEGPWRPIGERFEVEIPKGRVVIAQLADAEGRASSVLKAQAPRPTSGLSFWLLFLPNLTAMVGFWATLSLNIPDFTRFARSQKDQVLGQLYGLPTTMALYAFIGVAVTCASVVVFKDILVVEDAPWDPVALLGRFKSPVVIVVAMFMLCIATLTTNIAANVVSPANDFSNLAPRWISFRTGGILTAILGILIQPWKLIATTQGYIFSWLIGYGALLGPIGGIMIADYFIVRRQRLNVDELYRTDGEYGYSGGFHLTALAILVVAVLPSVPGFLVHGGFVADTAVPAGLRSLYEYAWFVGFAVAFVLYAALAKRPQQG